MTKILLVEDSRGDARLFAELLREVPRQPFALTTVATLADPSWLELSLVIPEGQVRDLIPALFEAGARGIIELPINKIIG